ncbi:hypothetical protein BDF20DRAFT_891621 [Mycotypha africana]|uniref:uncharacterized protein n=1 Tax=Mycotypha africana TaxID=64632 RepID=UPI002301E5F8|nr:uncharacterized protein BDF20DRAFT_891621 [Mycotypha africana]KAI8970485.1 hypothetical protein BDF20DRAFT_891621 [Mycotypha africana]
MLPPQGHHKVLGSGYRPRQRVVVSIIFQIGLIYSTCLLRTFDVLTFISINYASFTVIGLDIFCNTFYTELS